MSTESLEAALQAVQQEEILKVRIRTRVNTKETEKNGKYHDLAGELKNIKLGRINKIYNNVCPTIFIAPCVMYSCTL